MKKSITVKFLSLFLSSLVLFSSVTSCSTSDSVEDFNKKEVAIQEALFDKDYNSLFDAKFEQNIQHYMNYGVESLFIENKINLEVLNAINWAKENNLGDNDEIYSEASFKELLYTFNLNENEINYIYLYLDLSKKIVSDNYLENSSNDYIPYFIETTACQDAVLTTLVATAIFTGVVIGTGGVGLPAAVGFFATKMYALRGMYKNC